MKIKDPLFWTKVKKQPSGCWEWQGAVNSNGYGNVKRTKLFGGNINTHRYAYYLEYGEVPKGDCCHTCDNRLCVNPDHLWDGTRKENLQDMINKGRGEHLNGGRRKLDKFQVEDIRTSKEETSVLSVKYKVDVTTIQRIRRKATYKEF